MVEATEGEGTTETQEEPKAETQVEVVDKPVEQPKEVIKIVIVYDGAGANIGVGTEGADPIFSMAEGSLEDILVQVPADVDAARELWKVSKIYPKATVPVPSEAPKPVPATTARSAPRAAPTKEIKKPTLQPSFDL